MIDNFSIIFSTLMVLYVVLRAVKLDRVRPWFETRSMYEKALPEETVAARKGATRKATGTGKPRVPVELLTNGSANRR